MITIADAIKAINPDAEFAYDDNDYSTLRWFEWNTNPNPPSWEEVQLKMQELTEVEPFRLLRIVRDKLLIETDWVSGEDIPKSLKDIWYPYRQALRDLPSVSTPRLTEEGNLDMNSVNWPIKP
jgi:hypothetical protein